MAERDMTPVGLDYFHTARHRRVTHLTLAASPTEVFHAIASRPETWHQWFPGFTAGSRYESDPPHGLGSERVMFMRSDPIYERVIAWEEPGHWAFCILRASMPGARTLAEDYRFEPSADGTLVTWTVAFDGSLLLRLMMAVTGGPIVRRAFKNLERLLADERSGEGR